MQPAPNKITKIFLYSLVGIGSLIIISYIIIIYTKYSPLRAVWTLIFRDTRYWSLWVLINYLIGVGGKVFQYSFIAKTDPAQCSQHLWTSS
jgi:hypothetical protein